MQSQNPNLSFICWLAAHCRVHWCKMRTSPPIITSFGCSRTILYYCQKKTVPIVVGSIIKNLRSIMRPLPPKTCTSPTILTVGSNGRFYKNYQLIRFRYFPESAWIDTGSVWTDSKTKNNLRRGVLLRSSAGQTTTAPVFSSLPSAIITIVT